MCCSIEERNVEVEKIKDLSERAEEEDEEDEEETWSG